MSPPDESPARDDEGAPEIDALEDPDELLALAKRYRAGDGVPRDLLKCYRCYVAAAELGSAEAAYAAALFTMTGGVVPQDLKDGAARLRAAADGGVLAARVYLGNLYELGIHFRADADKADVWYRSAARAAAIKDAPGSPAHDRALAALGCVRYAIARKDDPEVAEEEREAWLRKAKTLGYQLKLREEAAARASAVPPEPAEETDDARPQEPTGGAGPLRPSATEPAEAPSRSAAARPRQEASPARARPSNARSGAGASAYALLFAATGVGAGIALRAAAQEAIARGATLPVIGTRAALVLPVVAVLIGVLPGLLVYRVGAFARALLVGGALAAAGWYGAVQPWWPPGWAFWPREIWALALGLGGYLLVALVLGLRGGVKKAPPKTRD